MFCSKCGTELADTAKFCSKCGKSTQRQAAAGQQPMPMATSTNDTAASVPANTAREVYISPEPPVQQAYATNSVPGSGSKSFKEKMAEGIDASGGFAFAEVQEATERVVSAMGEKMAFIYSMEESAGMIVLGFFKSGAQKFWTASLMDLAKTPDMLAAVSVDEANGTVEVDILDAKTSQETVFFIPVTPKAVHGITTYRDFLAYFEAELRRIRPYAAINRR